MSHPFPAQLFAQTPHTGAVHAALTALMDAVDAAKAAGVTIPPVAAVGCTNLGVSLVSMAGSEAEAAGVPSPFAGMHGPVIARAVEPSPVPAAFGGAR